MNLVKRLCHVADYIVTLPVNRKKRLSWLLILIPVVAITGAIWLKGQGAQLNTLQKTGPLLLFLGSGCINLFLLYRKIYVPGLQFIKSLFAYSLILSILIAGGLLAYNNGAQMDMALACAAAFLLPVAVAEVWNYYHAMYKQTAIDESSSEFWDDVILTGTISIRFIVEAGNAMVAPGSYKVQVPECWKLSRAFYSAFQQNIMSRNRFELDDESCYGWVFFLETFMGTVKSKLDPAMSLEDNGLRRHSVIRVKPTMIHKWPAPRPLRLTDYSKN